jgi:(1->4)-alpha-D-glucan 1-alpha-D-glucosylmutase
MTNHEPPRPRIPVSTYRLQFNHRFTFLDAKRIVPYLEGLGISDLYASPYFMAKAGSLHGYDIVDPHLLNPEIGTEEEYFAFIEALRRQGMGQILDIVPNHMCVTSDRNRWWMDVLENGPSSHYAHFFDIDWNPVKKELRNKVLLPILGDQYGTVLESGSLQLTYRDGGFFVSTGDFALPIRPQTYAPILEHRLAALEATLPEKAPAFAELMSITTALNHLPPHTETDPERIKERYREKEIIKKRLSNLYDTSPPIRAFIDENIVRFNGRKDQPRSFDLLDRLLDEQAYRLSYWRVAAEEINYRRFFDVNDLAALRSEDPQVFEESHRLVFELIGKGAITGLRIDHPDGLYNPAEYFTRLQRCCAERTGSGTAEELAEPSGRPALLPFYIVGEKILIRGERMPEDWPIYSTTGYVFMNSVNGIFLRVDQVRAMDRIYARFVKRKTDFQTAVYDNKKLVTQISLSSEINTLGHSLDGISEKSRHTRDFTLNSLVSAIVEAIAFFPVYRTYINASGVNDRDRKYIELAISKAKRKNPGMSESVFDFLKDVLLLKYPETMGEEDRKEWLHFVMRFQQVTGPVMAKGIEDTTFYVYNRLVSLNEVGGSPDRFGTPLETFHGQNIERNKYWPHALIATSTHDSKRGEDLRARINVLSEIPAEWRERVIRWVRINRKKKPAVDGHPVPGPNEEYLLYQTLIGAWPVEPGAADDATFKKRISDYMIKAVREAKVDTSWINPNEPYEEALAAFIERILDPGRNNPFLQDFVPFQKRISHFGMLNSLSQTLLKITVPGVPDFYQGTELWSFDLVDPDNRRPVDYRTRADMLDALMRRESEVPLSDLGRELLARKEDGRIKLYLTCKALTYRRAHRDLFGEGEYVPLEVQGERADHVCAFERRKGDLGAIVIAPRFYTDLAEYPDGLPVGPAVWKDTAVRVSSADGGARYRNALTGEEVAGIGGGTGVILPLSEALSNFPVALLEKHGAP